MLQTSMPGEWREGLHSKQNPSEKGPHNLAHSRRALSRKLEVTRTEMTEKEWGARCDSMKKRPCSHNPPSAVTVGASPCRSVQQPGGGAGAGRLTEESAISLRVWSDPTAKIILLSGETVTQL